MIQSAMMFALGFFLSGLLWLAFSAALVRRARRLTERRLLASISTRRVEFETERDELRARHALEMHRLEKEVSRVLDTATAYRLEADVNTHDVVSMKAELLAREEDAQELQARLATERETIQDLERRHAEATSALRSVQHALKLEVARRSQAEEALDEAGVVTDQRQITLKSLRSEIDELRSALGERFAPEDGKLPRILMPPPGSPQPAAEAPAHAEHGGSVVPLHTRPRPVQPETAEQAAARVDDAARDLQRIAGEAHGDLGKSVWRAPANTEAPASAGQPTGEASVAELLAHRMAAVQAGPGEAKPAEPKDRNSEARFFEALAEIRALKRTAGQAGE